MHRLTSDFFIDHLWPDTSNDLHLILFSFADYQDDHEKEIIETFLRAQGTPRAYVFLGRLSQNMDTLIALKINPGYIPAHWSKINSI